MMPGIRLWKTQKDQSVPIKCDDATVILESQALSLRWPFGGWVWNRPVAALVTDHSTGETRRLPIRNVTRLARLALFGATLAFLITIWLNARQEGGE